MQLDVGAPQPLPAACSAAQLFEIAHNLSPNGNVPIGIRSGGVFAIALALRTNGDAPYLAITTEIRRHLDHCGAAYRLTCRNDRLNGMTTWDLQVTEAKTSDIRSLLDWLAPIYGIQL